MTFPRSSASECERQCSPTKFEAARSLFCWARRRFAPAKCRNALLLSSKSAKLSFSQEKLLTTHCHEPAHISHQWTCESVSGSHLRKRSDEENPQRCYDPSDDRDGTAGVPSAQPVLVREPTSAFSSSLGRLVLSSMLDAKEQGRSAPRKTPSYLSPNQGIDPLT